MKIYIDSKGIKEISNSIISTTELLDYHIASLKEQVEELTKYWEGEDSKKYVKVMRKKNIPAVEKVNELLKEYGKYLNEIPDVYELLDELYSNEPIE